MKSYPRDWIAWSFAAAVVIVATVTLMAAASAAQTERTADRGSSTPAVNLA